jgi:transposase
MGRSRGGLTTKIHALVDSLGNPLRFELTAGQEHDSIMGYEILQSIDFSPENVLGDKAYDTNRILELLEKLNINAVIPSKKNRLVQRELDKEIYKERHLVECFFNKIKHYRRLASRFDKLSVTFLSFLTLASIMIWLV